MDPGNAYSNTAPIVEDGIVTPRTRWNGMWYNITATIPGCTSTFCPMRSVVRETCGGGGGDFGDLGDLDPHGHTISDQSSVTYNTSLFYTGFAARLEHHANRSAPGTAKHVHQQSSGTGHVAEELPASTLLWRVQQHRSCVEKHVRLGVHVSVGLHVHRDDGQTHQRTGVPLLVDAVANYLWLTYR